MAGFEIVIFHAAAPGRAPASKDDLGGPAQIDLLYRSAIAANPKTTLTLLTTEHTDLSALSVPFQRINGNVDTNRIMFERTRMQKEYVAGAQLKRPLAFLDSDILVCRDLAPLFDRDFDIALTWRASRTMPINGGVIFANNRRPDCVVRFFELLESVYREQQQQHLDWYGDQYALSQIAGTPPEQLSEIKKHDETGIRYLFLPRDQYNYTPNRRRRLSGGPGEIYLLHFKGQSRRYMKPYWTYWIGPQKLSHLSRLAGMMWTAIKFAATARSYRKGARRRSNLFNLAGQNNQTWHDRADAAVDFVAKIGKPDRSGPLRLSDIGCGDAKLAAKLRDRGLAIQYAGYDLHPQSSEVRRLDVSSQDIPESADVVVTLGVMEYLANPQEVLRKFARCAPWLVISLSPKDLHKKQQVQGLNWRTYLTTSEFEEMLRVAGYSILENRITPDGRSRVWLASQARTEASP